MVSDVIPHKVFSNQIIMKNNQPAQYNRVIPVLAVALMTGLGCKTTTSQPYLTTQSPMTLISSNDGEYNQLFQLTDDQTTDWELKTKDSFTVIHLGPDHPPIIKTVYDTVPCTIYGTPTMAMSSDGRYALIANHSWRPENAQKLKLPAGPQTNADLTPEMLKHPKMTAQHVNMLSLIDLSTPEYGVVNRVLLTIAPCMFWLIRMGNASSLVATNISMCIALRMGSWSNSVTPLTHMTRLVFGFTRKAIA